MLSLCSVLTLSWSGVVAQAATSSGGEARPRVIVSTDIGGTDPDDFQSMVHFLVYADRFDIEGIVSSPYGPGRKEHVLQVLAAYARDFENLRSHSARFPTPDALRAVTVEGALDSPGPAGFAAPTEGSQWIVRCARREDPRPLWVLVWGGIEDVAQALHDAPDILPKLRVYFIGGPNKKWSVDAYHYLERNHPTLWLIEANATYRGWFVGGEQGGAWGNTRFVAEHIAGRGALGEFFAPLLKGTMKMGDTPSVVYLLDPRGTPEDPTQPSWGGQFVRAWERPRAVYDRLTTADDRVEQFGVLEMALARGHGVTRDRQVHLLIDGQATHGFVEADGTLRFRFSPKDAKTYTFTLEGAAPEIAGRRGAFTAFRPAADAASQPAVRLPQWWTDNPAPEWSEGPHIGAKTVSRWRVEFLRDFAARMEWCRTPATETR